MLGLGCATALTLVSLLDSPAAEQARPEGVANSLTGQVTDAQLHPLAGVCVRVCGIETCEDGRWLRNDRPHCVLPRPALTDPSGRFTLRFTRAASSVPFDGTKTRINLWFDKPEYGPVYCPAVNPQSDPLQVVLPQGIRISGTVTRRVEGRLVPAAKVAVRLQCVAGDVAQQRRVSEDPYFFLLGRKTNQRQRSDLPLLRQAVTDATGRYSFVVSVPPLDKSWYISCGEQGLILDAKHCRRGIGPDFVTE